MRAIKFRGRDEEGQWYYGLLSWYTDVLACINDGTDWEVNPETVGQYTGKKDVNKKEIFEGDVVYFLDDRAHERIGVIKWHEKACCWIIDCGGEAGRVMLANYAYEIMLAYYACEIIGNVYDNPELLEEMK